MIFSSTASHLNQPACLPRTCNGGHGQHKHTLPNILSILSATGCQVLSHTVSWKCLFAMKHWPISYFANYRYLWIFSPFSSKFLKLFARASSRRVLGFMIGALVFFNHKTWPKNNPVSFFPPEYWIWPDKVSSTCENNAVETETRPICTSFKN